MRIEQLANFKVCYGVGLNRYASTLFGKCMGLLIYYLYMCV